jgi:hypothetical protein
MLELARAQYRKFHRVLSVQFGYGTIRIIVLELAELSCTGMSPCAKHAVPARDPMNDRTGTGRAHHLYWNSSTQYGNS